MKKNFKEITLTPENKKIKDKEVLNYNLTMSCKQNWPGLNPSVLSSSFSSCSPLAKSNSLIYTKL